MRITIQFLDGCPHWDLAEQRLRQAAKDLGRDDVEVIRQRIDSPEGLGFKESLQHPAHL